MRLSGWAMLVVGGLIVLGGVWIAVTGLLARNQLTAARSEIGTLRSQLVAANTTAAAQTASSISQHASRAHALTTGPAWATLAALPEGGQPFQTVRAITSQVDVLGDQVLPGLVAASRQLQPSDLRNASGRIDVDKIAAIAPTLADADKAITHATATVQSEPAKTWLSPVDDARASLINQLTGVAKTVRSADLVARIVPPMLGQHGVKRYFVAFQNDAEARGTGGIPGAFAIVRVDHGAISFERFEPDNTLGRVPTGLNFGRDYDKLFTDGQSTSLYVNSNLSPQFSYAARVWIAMWHKHTGEKLDGAVAIDPTAVSYLLGATGPAQLHDGTTVSAANVTALTEKDVYAKFPRLGQNQQRKNYLLAIAKAVSKRVLSGAPDFTSLVRAAGRAAGERRLLVYSTDSGVERDLDQTSVSGAIPTTSNPYVGLAVVNVGGNKLDYYLQRKLAWRRTGCGATRSVTATVTLTNAAPAHGLSAYVTNRADAPGYPVKPGDNRLAVYYYASDGAKLDGLDLDGQQIAGGHGRLRGHPVFVADVELPRGKTRTVVFHLSEPAGTGSPIVLDQPLVNPLVVSLDDSKCG